MYDSASDEGTPSYRVVDTFAEQAACIDVLLGLANARVRVFDFDLKHTGWSSAGRADALARFLLGSREARLQVVVQDVRYLETSCPRLTSLLRRFSAAITIYRAGSEARSAFDPLLIVDDRHFMHRFHYTQPRAAVAIDQPGLAKPLVQRFDEIWATGEPGLTGDVLGL
ncbi:MAG: hypothetical protein M3Z31_14435 [Pseudomonadota bacterium]|nr:hypothetical protein [Pseudomonadota bacterium]